MERKASRAAIENKPARICAKPCPILGLIVGSNTGRKLSHHSTPGILVRVYGSPLDRLGGRELLTGNTQRRHVAIFHCEKDASLGRRCGSLVGAGS